MDPYYLNSRSHEQENRRDNLVRERIYDVPPATLGPEEGEPDDLAFVRELVETLDDADWMAASTAQERLSRLGPRAVEAVRAALREGSWGARWRAAWVLGRLGDLSAVADLREALCRPPQPKVFGGSKGDVRVDQPTREQLTLLRLECAEALGRIGDPAGANGLLVALEDSVEAVRRKAAESLVRLGPAALPQLKVGLAIGDEAVCLAALEEIAETKSPTHFPILVTCLESPSGRIRGTAARSLRILAPTASWEEQVSALEPLRRLCSGWSLEGDELRRAYREALDLLDSLTGETRSLPRPSAEGDSALDRLPLPSTGPPTGSTAAGGGGLVERWFDRLRGRRGNGEG